MTAIIVLNWNGYQDTIDCLKSIYHIPSDFFVVVADNGSTDDSIPQIESFLHTAGIAYSIAQRGDWLKETPISGSGVLLRNGQNLGFARGNNAALRFCGQYLPEHLLLLNNDTVVEADFLMRLETFIQAHPMYETLTPMICYHKEKEKIWNCGGKQFWGFRKYYYANRYRSDVKETGHLDVTFLTGCALFCRSSLVKENGALLSENFFFGEEDFNFCLNMNRQKRKMACVLDAVIYHKVSSSTKKQDSIGKTYIYYLNRFIDIRQNSSSLFYLLWSHTYAIYVWLLLKRKGMTSAQAYRLQKRIREEAARKETVSLDDYLAAIGVK